MEFEIEEVISEIQDVLREVEAKFESEEEHSDIDRARRQGANFATTTVRQRLNHIKRLAGFR